MGGGGRGGSVYVDFQNKRNLTEDGSERKLPCTPTSGFEGL